MPKYHRYTNLLRTLCLLTLAIPVAAVSKQSPTQTVSRHTLNNGLRVVIVENNLAPVVTTQLNYLVGSNEAPRGFPGMAHGLEHMMFRGSKGLSAGQLANILAAMGGEFNADTQQTVTQYYFTLPAEDLDLALHIHAIRMQNLLNTDTSWMQERKAIEQEVAQDLSEPEYIVYTKLLSGFFHGTPYAHDALGSQASFQQTTPKMLQQFYDHWYAPNNAILVVVGDVDAKKTLANIESLFGDIPAKTLPDRPKIRLEPVKAQRLEINTDSALGTALIAFRMPGYKNKDYAAGQVLADALDSERGKLYQLVVDGVAVSTDFSVDTLPEAGIGYASAMFPAGTNGADVLKALREALSQVLAQGIDPGLVTAAKRYEITNAELQKNSISGLAMAWSQALAVEGRNSPQDDIDAIQKVSVADVNRVARSYLDFAHGIEAVLSPMPSGQPVAATVKRPGKAESFTPEHATPVPLPKWAQASAERITVPPFNPHPTQSILPNGLNLIVQLETISDTVSVYGYIKNRPELEEPAGKEGVSLVLEQLFPFGTTSLDRVAFQRAVDDIGAMESAGSEFSIQMLSAHFDRGVQLLAQNELQPALPAKAFDGVRTQVTGIIAGKLQSPDFLTRQALKQALFPKQDPSHRHPTAASVSSLKLADVKEYYRHAFRPDLTTIVVIGNVNPDDARKTIEKYFGKWRSAGPKPETDLPPVPRNEPSMTLVPNNSRVQAKVVLAETLGCVAGTSISDGETRCTTKAFNRFNPDYYALELGNHVLGGGFYATRLFRDLREETGLVYDVTSTFMVGRTRGIYLVKYACNPDNVDKARAIVLRDLREMQNSLIDEKQLRRAKALLLKEIPLSQASTDEIAIGFIERSDIGLPLDEPERAGQRYAALTAAEIRGAYAKWLRVDDLAQVVEGMSPK